MDARMTKGLLARIRRLLQWVLCSCALSALAAPVVADVVNLKNGDRLTGKVDSIAGGRVILDTEFAGRVLVHMEHVASLETEEAYDVRTKEGAAVTGRFLTGPEGQVLVVADDQSRPIEVAEVRDAGQSKLALTRLVAEWSTRADLSAAVSTGNSDTESYNALVESILKRDRVSHGFTLLLSQEKADNESTKDQTQFDYAYKRFVSEKWYAAGNAQYFQDDLKDIDYRLTAGAGMGYQFWDDSFGALSTEAGLSYVYEKNIEGKERDPALRWALDYNRFLWSKRLEFFSKNSVLAILASGRGEVYQSSTGLRLAVNDHLDTAFRVDLRHETDPPADNKKTDTTYSLGVGVKF